MRRFSSTVVFAVALFLAAPALADGIYGGCSLANPTAKVGLAAVNGSASTCMRSDAAPPLDQTISPTFVGLSLSGANNQIFMQSGSNNLIWTPAGDTGSLGVGAGALGNQTGTNSANTAVGKSACANVTTGTANVCIGNQAGNGGNPINMIAIGYQALAAQTTSGESDDVAIGAYALLNLTTGAQVVAIGRHAGGNLSTGSQATAIGDYVLGNGASRITGINNTGLGFQAALNAAGAAHDNTCLGASSCASLTTGTGVLVLGSGIDLPGGVNASNVMSLAGIITATGINAPSSAAVTMNGTVTHAGLVVTASYTVATLPAGTAGARALVTDANAACTFNAAPTGGGSTKCPVWFNGSAWVEG